MTGTRKPRRPDAVATTNACKLCTPMGACLALRGIAGAVPFLHGSQGCATYMRRYIISHFNEPIDIASSALGEKNAVFGGGPNLKLGLKNVIEKYRPRLVGVATTCLTETIGDDVAMIVGEFRREVRGAGLPPILHVATPSYSGTHADGFQAVVVAAVRRFVRDDVPAHDGVNLLPGFCSPADLRHLRELVTGHGLPVTVLPDFSDTLDGPALDHYPRIPAGGTTLEEIGLMAGARATIECTWVHDCEAGRELEKRHHVPLHPLPPPLGLRATDRFVELLAELGGTPPPWLAGERGRLLDAMVDGHKYVAGKRVVVYGEEDLVAGLTAFLAEIGAQPVLCASGGRSGRLAEAVARACGDLVETPPEVVEDCDFFAIEQRAAELAPDLLLGHSKGYGLARRLAIPLVRVGFPIHDRLGGQRLLHCGYRGAQQLFDRLANALIQAKQDASPVGYSYM